MIPSDAELVHLYLSPGHNYFGRHGQPADTHAMVEVDELICLAGRGLAGDRFLDFKPGYRGQITFFALETHEHLQRLLGGAQRGPSLYRRNVVTRGLNLNVLIGEEFEIQGVRFAGTEESRPCGWMDQAFGPGAEKALRGMGGLRARILTSGVLRAGNASAANGQSPRQRIHSGQ